MAVREILGFPHSGLRAVAERVNSFDAELRSLTNDLLETMRAAPGIGITALHIGVPRRLAVIELPSKTACFYVNPQIDWVSAELVRYPKAAFQCLASRMTSSVLPAFGCATGIWLAATRWLKPQGFWRSACSTKSTNSTAFSGSTDCPG
jgi:hypothetical protein